MTKDLTKEVKELNKRISELEKIISNVIKPIQDVNKITRNYMRIIGLLLDRGGLTPDMTLPDVKDPISREIVRVLLDKTDQVDPNVKKRQRIIIFKERTTPFFLVFK